MSAEEIINAIKYLGGEGEAKSTQVWAWFCIFLNNLDAGQYSKVLSIDGIIIRFKKVE